MTLQLHVWGPAFSLPSIDAECLATITYVTQTLPASAYTLIQTSPSAIPTHQLPTLYDPITNTHVSGYLPILHHIHTHRLSTPLRPTPDSTAYTTYLLTHAVPLLALYLYVSSANYSAATRPAYSKILPFPLAWTEPPALRVAMTKRAAHLGLDSLDTDSLRREDEEEGWLQVPAQFRKVNKGVEATLSPEERSRIRLEGVARDVLDVLGEVNWKVMGLEVRCLGWAFLALMVVPDVPKTWLREMVGRYEGLEEFVTEGRSWFGDLSWEVEGRVAKRLIGVVLGDVPAVGQAWRRWWARWRIGVGGEGGELLGIMSAGVILAMSVLAWRKLPKLGAPLQVWERQLPGLLGLGAAGAMLGHFAGLPSGALPAGDAWR